MVESVEQGLIRFRPSHQATTPPNNSEYRSAARVGRTMSSSPRGWSKPAPRQIADRSLGRIEVGEGPRPAASEVAEQLDHRERRGMEFQDPAKDRCLLALVFVKGR
jgi:hypothetical protein